MTQATTSLNDKAGRLFIWGKVSRNDTEGTIKEATPVPYFFDEPVIQVACGLGFTAILTGKCFNL